MQRRHQLKTPLASKNFLGKENSKFWSLELGRNPCLREQNNKATSITRALWAKERVTGWGWRGGQATVRILADQQSFLASIHFLTDVICAPPVPRPIMLLFMVQKSNFFSSEIYSQHSLLPFSRTHPSNNQDLYGCLSIWVSSPDLKVTWYSLHLFSQYHLSSSELAALY